MAATRSALRRGLAELARANKNGSIVGARASWGGVMVGQGPAVAGAAAREGGRMFHRCAAGSVVDPLLSLDTKQSQFYRFDGTAHLVSPRVSFVARGVHLRRGRTQKNLLSVFFFPPVGGANIKTLSSRLDFFLVAERCSRDVPY